SGRCTANMKRSTRSSAMAVATTSKPAPLLVFADDWGRHPSSCQHLVRHLLDRHEVFWVNTIGTRPPRLDWATVSRAPEKLKQWLLRALVRKAGDHNQTPHANLHLLNPRMWPSFGSTVERRINRSLLVRQLAPRISELSEPPIAITNIPIVAD